MHDEFFLSSRGFVFDFFKMPDLVNQILLVALKLNDNSIFKINDVKGNYWMPLLKLIDLNQNRLNEIDVLALRSHILLNDMLLENNDICDLGSIVNIDKTRINLSRIHLRNNPIINDDDLSNLADCKLTEDYVLHRQVRVEDESLKTFSNNLNLLLDKIESFKPKPPQSIADLNGFIQNLVTSNEFLVKLRYIFELNDTKFLLTLNASSFQDLFGSYEIVHVPIKPLRDTTNNFQFKRCLSSRMERKHKADDYKTYLTSNFTMKKLNQCAVVIQSKWKGLLI